MHYIRVSNDITLPFYAAFDRQMKLGLKHISIHPFFFVHSPLLLMELLLHYLNKRRIDEKSLRKKNGSSKYFHNFTLAQSIWCMHTANGSEQSDRGKKNLGIQYQTHKMKIWNCEQSLCSNVIYGAQRARVMGMSVGFLWAQLALNPCHATMLHNTQFRLSLASVAYMKTHRDTHTQRE